MSILNRPSDGLFNVMIVLYRCLLSEGAMTRARLTSFCAPSTAIEDPGHVTRSINTALKIGLFEEKEEDTVAIASTLPVAALDPALGADRLQHTLRERLLARENTPDIWATEAARAADFTRAASWMLSQDVLKLQGATWEDISNLQARQVREPYQVFGNDTRWTGFRSWAVFLGFGWVASFPRNESFVADPTEAIEAFLPAIFGEAAELSQNVFFTRLAELVPVVDGGVYRRAVEAQLKEEAWKSPSADRVSLSLSLALVRLHRAGVLQLEDRDDPRFGIRRLTGREGRDWHKVTHVRFSGGTP